VRGSHGPSCDERRSWTHGSCSRRSLASPARPPCGCRLPSPHPRPSHPPPSPPCGEERVPPGLRSRSKRWPIARVGTADPKACATFLSWDPSAWTGTCRSLRHPPLHRHHRERPLPRNVPAALRQTRCHPRPSCSVHVVSHHLDGFLRSRFAGLLHPAADPGVHCVSRTPPGGRRSDSGTHARSSQCGSVPLEGLSPPTAAPRHRGRCPLAVAPSWRRRTVRPTVSSPSPICVDTDGTRLRGLAPSSGPRPHSTVAGGAWPDPPWAWFPFEVSPTGRSSALPPGVGARPALHTEEQARTPQLRSAPRGSRARELTSWAGRPEAARMPRPSGRHRDTRRRTSSMSGATCARPPKWSPQASGRVARSARERGVRFPTRSVSLPRGHCCQVRRASSARSRPVRVAATRVGASHGRTASPLAGLNGSDREGSGASGVFPESRFANRSSRTSMGFLTSKNAPRSDPRGAERSCGVRACSSV
jgi:hypothetical protein